MPTASRIRPPSACSFGPICASYRRPPTTPRWASQHVEFEHRDFADVGPRPLARPHTFALLLPGRLQLPDGDLLELGAAAGGEDLDRLAVAVGEDLVGDGTLAAVGEDLD